jgi:hypothetical protein
MNILVKINTASLDTGPFMVYTNHNNYQAPAYGPYTRAQMLAGVTISVPDSTIGVRVRSNGVCTNDVITLLPVPSTTTTTSTTTLPPCECAEIDTTGGGVYSVTWRNCENIEESINLSNELYKVCALRGSINYTGTGAINVMPIGTSCSITTDCWEEFIMEATQLSSLLINVLTSTGKYAIEWEPGVVDFYNASNTSRSHTYPTPFTGQVKIKAPSLTFITRLILTTNSVPTPASLEIYGPEIIKLTKLQTLDIGYGNSQAKLFCDTTDLTTTTLTSLRVYKGTVTGNIAALPNIMTDLQLYGGTTVSGNIQDLPTTLQTLAIYGSNTLTGNLANLPIGNKPTLKTMELLGQNTITGDIGNLAGYTVIQRIRLEGLNTITGDISGISGLTTLISFVIYGKNKLSGNLSSLIPLTVLDRFVVDNNNIYLSPTVGNIITGDIDDIPSSVTRFVLGIFNTVYGNISTLPAGITNFEVRQEGTATSNITGNLSSITTRPLTNFVIIGGAHTITGLVTELPSTLIRFYAETSGSISGDLKDLPTNLDSCSILSNNAASIFTYTPAIKTWPSFMRTLDIYTINPAVPNLTFIDDLVIELGNSTWAVVNVPSTWGLRLKGTLTNPAAIAAAAAIDVNTAVTFYT